MEENNSDIIDRFFEDLSHRIDFFIEFLKIKDNADYNFLAIKEERVKKIMCEKICTICIDNLKVNQKIKVPLCNHIFHRDCLYKWCKKSFTCPDCRQTLSKK